MIEREAESLVDLMRELWPWKGGWNPATIGLWVESIARPDWNSDQCEAVIRDERRQHDGAKPRMSVVLARCHEAHKPARKAVPNPGGMIPVTPEEWAVIHRDREGAAAWWHENKPDREEIVRLACLAYPMWAAKWRKFLADDFKPNEGQCMALKAAWQQYHDVGARPKPEHEPGLMAGMAMP